MKEEDILKAQVESKQIKAIKTKENRGIHIVASAEIHESCFICEGVDHLAQDCLTLGEMRGCMRNNAMPIQKFSVNHC